MSSWKWSVRVAGCSGSPFSRVNTLPESTHAGLYAIRSTSCARRCANSAATVPASSATVRSPVPDFGAPMTSHPAAPAAATRSELPNKIDIFPLDTRCFNSA